MRPRTIHLLWMTSALAAAAGADDKPGSAPCSQETSVVGTVGASILVDDFLRRYPLR